MPTKKNLIPDLEKLWESADLERAADGSPYANLMNMARILKNHTWFKGNLWYDEFHQKTFSTWESERPREWSDADDLLLTEVVQRDFHIRKIGLEIVSQAVRLVASRDIRNEPRDWMESLEWDGEERIATFFPTCLGTEDTKYSYQAGKNFWIGMAARVFSPGCKLDNMVILEGAQGIGKSTAISIIGGKWYAEGHESVQNKDFFMILAGKMIVEIAEMQSFNKADETRIKQAITCQSDRYRAPYASHAQDHPRMSVFIGTTNEDYYMRDHTGGRRFWPLTCKDINLDLIAEYRDQFFAEAVHLYKSGEKWWIMPEEMTRAAQAQRLVRDAWEDVIRTYLIGKPYVRLIDVGVDGLKIDTANFDIQKQKRVANILRILKWTDKQKRLEPGKNAEKIWLPEDVA